MSIHVIDKFNSEEKMMKTLILIGSLLLVTACSSNPKLASHGDYDGLCEGRKSDYQYFRTAFEKEHIALCSNGCTYTPSMNKNSDTMERVAGMYYLKNCDLNHGRL